MREEYDLSNAVKGRHAERYDDGVTAVVDGMPAEVDFSRGTRGRFLERVKNEANAIDTVKPAVDPKAS